MKSLILNLLFASLVASEATVYLIRHGEKPNSGNGLSKEGKERANCLVNVFNTSSPYEIGHIMAETPHSDGSQQRPYDTVLPLAESLNLTVDTSCDRDDQECVAGVVSNYTGPGNILICWEHDQLSLIVGALGDANPPSYPNDAYNLIWTNPYDYSNVTNITSENCPGLDD